AGGSPRPGCGGNRRDRSSSGPTAPSTTTTTSGTTTTPTRPSSRTWPTAGRLRGGVLSGDGLTRARPLHDPAEVGDEAPARRLDHDQAGVEAGVVPVVGVGNVDGGAGGGVEAAQQDQPLLEPVVARPGPGQAGQRLPVAAVEAHEDIGGGEPGRCEGA